MRSMRKALSLLQAVRDQSRGQPLQYAISARYGSSFAQTRSQFRKSGQYEHFNNRSSGFSSYQDLASQRTLKWIGFAAGGCFLVWVTNRQEIPYTGRKHFILVPTSLELSIGASTFSQIQSDAKAQGTLLPESHPATKMVKRIGSRIAAKASDDTGVAGHMGHMKGLKWEFAVIDSPEVNAFVVPGATVVVYTDFMKVLTGALPEGLKWEFAVIDSPEVNAFVVPGGKVVVYTGLMKLLEGPVMETQLAAVLGHEIAHVVARHAAERMTENEVSNLARAAFYIIVGIPVPAGAAAAVFFLPHSRKAETEADSIGMRLAAKACYDPSAAAAVFQKLGAEEERAGDRMPGFLRTHPLTQDRIKNVQKQLPAASLMYEASNCEEAKRFTLDSIFGPRPV